MLAAMLVLIMIRPVQLLMCERPGVLHMPVVSEARTLVRMVSEAKQNRLELTSALLLASERGSKTAVAQLLDRGADANAMNNLGETALLVASKSDNTETVALLLDRVADPEAATKALMVASENGATQSVALLLDRGADVNVANGVGGTPLMAASRYGRTRTAALLLDRGANVNAADNNGVTALAWACSFGHTETIQMLERRMGVKGTARWSKPGGGGGAKVAVVAASLAAITLSLGDWSPSALESQMRTVQESPSPAKEAVVQVGKVAEVQAPIVARKLREEVAPAVGRGATVAARGVAGEPECRRQSQP